jgi:polyhydroxybutyrate depolymerase
MLRFANFTVALLAPCICSAIVAASPPAMSVEKTISVDGLSRKYLLFVPAQANNPSALLVVLHGGGSNARQMERYTQFDELAEREGFVVMYPESVGGNWNDGRKIDFIRAQRENIDDVKFIRAAVADLAKEIPIDRGRVFATGISNGAIMSHRLAAEASDVFAAVATVAGEMAPSVAEHFQPQYPVSVLIIHGDADPLVPISGGDVRVPGGRARGKVLGAKDTLAKYLARNHNPDGASTTMLDADAKDGTSVEITKYPEGPSGEKAWFYLVKTGGHTWPGRPLYLSENIIGKASQDFAATDVIWQFFQTCPPRKLDGGKRAP